MAAATAIELPAQRETVAAKILRGLARAPVHLVLVVLGALWLVPTFGLLITSLLPAGVLASKGWWTIFSHPSLATWSNYSALFHNSGLITALKTTAYIAVGNTLIIVVIAALAGYALAWLDFPGRDWLFIAVVGLLVVPLQMALIPMFRLYNSFHLYDTVFGIILFHVAFGLPFAIFLLRNFFVGLPKDILELRVALDQLVRDAGERPPERFRVEQNRARRRDGRLGHAHFLSGLSGPS